MYVAHTFEGGAEKKERTRKKEAKLLEGKIARETSIFESEHTHKVFNPSARHMHRTI
jgi:hypothetical protein